MKNHQPNIKLNINKISSVSERCMYTRCVRNEKKKFIQHNELHLRKV